MLEPTRVKNVLDIYLSSEKEYVENDKMCEPHFPECCQFTLISNTRNSKINVTKLCSHLKYT